MPSRTAASQRERDYDFSNVGKVGRRTGITLAPRTLDEHGMEEISGLFSSPRKVSTADKRVIMESVEQDGEKTPREVDRSRANPITPGTSASLRRSARGTSHPPPRSSSPRKSGISGTARRAGTADVLAQRQSQQETQGVAEDAAQSELNNAQSSTTPLQAVVPKAVSAKAATVRRFGPDRTPLRNRVLNRQSKSAYVGRISDAQPSVQVDIADDVQEETPSHINTEHLAQEEALMEEEGLMIDDEDEDIPAILESEREEAEPELPLPPPIDDEDEDQTFEPPARTMSRRGPQNKANSRRKRKSDALDDAEGILATSSPAAKRAKRRSNEGIASSQKVVEESIAQHDTTKVKSKRCRKPLASKDQNTSLSSQRPKELDDIVEKIKARPGPKKSLYILRRETPAEDNVTRTRSGRVTIKPLAYWRNEGIVYGGGSPSGTNIVDGDRFPLLSIKEIVRTEEQLEPARKPGVKGKAKKGKSKARQSTEDDVDLDIDGGATPLDPEADDWELDTGTLKGSVAVWDQDQQAPLDDEEVVDLAHSADAIQTNEVKGSTFRYAKIVSTRFFGTGIVDLPPGAVKKTKNSRKMHMCFFVAQGRVTVVVSPLRGGETRFSIGKGGFWQVPRGNLYSIENEHGKTARIFFSQACEPVPNDLLEE